MRQLLLIADERPLENRLGKEFFQRAPGCPGVYIMRDARETALYVGKAKNLRKRLGNYRTANPDRMRRRHLKLLRAVHRIELQPCESEASALAKESALLKNLRPRFNRAGTWPRNPRFFLWQVTDSSLGLAVTEAAESDWRSFGEMGAAAFGLRASLVRLLWCAIHPARGLRGMPDGWFHGRYGEKVVIGYPPGQHATPEMISRCLQDLSQGGEILINWFMETVATDFHPFDAAVLAEDLELVKDMARRRNQGTS